MVFILIGFVWLFIFLVAFFGDYEEKELQKDYKYYKEITESRKDKTLFL